MVQKYQNEIAPTFYYGISTKTNEKDIKIPKLQPPDWKSPYWMSLYFCLQFILCFLLILRRQLFLYKILKFSQVSLSVILIDLEAHKDINLWKLDFQTHCKLPWHRSCRCWVWGIRWLRCCRTERGWGYPRLCSPRGRSPHCRCLQWCYDWRTVLFSKYSLQYNSYL